MSMLLRLPNDVVLQSCRQVFRNIVRHNSNQAAVTRTNRHRYSRTYPTMLVLPSGATITIRYKEPRRIIKLPLNLSTLTDAERQKRLLKRIPKKKIVIEDEIDDDFDVNKYSHLWKK